MVGEQDTSSKPLSKWQWLRWSVPLLGAVGIFVATLAIEGRRRVS